MIFLIYLILTLLFIKSQNKIIKKKSNILYIICTVISLLTVAGCWSGFAAKLPATVVKYLWDPLQNGTIATAIFVWVMYAGALKPGVELRKYLLPIRGEISIIASILTLGHNFALGRVYFFKLFTNPADFSIWQILASVCSVLMILIMLPLFITSFPEVRKKMDGRKWKKLQRWAYLFYGLIYVHVLLLFIPASRDGDTNALLNIIVFSLVFLAYAALRIKKAMEKRNKNSKFIPAAAIAVALVVAIFSMPAEIFDFIDINSSDKNNATGSDMSLYKDGTFEGKGRGYAGPVIAEVTIKDDVITDVNIVSQVEDEPYWTRSLVIIDDIIKTQDYHVDSVAGATKSCNGIRKAVKSALKQAKN